MVDLTNAQMVKAGIDAKYFTTANQIIQFLGIVILILHLPDVP